MNLMAQVLKLLLRRIPHARGDEPYPTIMVGIDPTYSPRTWG